MPAPKQAALPVSQQQLLKATAALLKHASQRQDSAKDLFDEDEFLYLVVALKNMPRQGRKDKPVRLPIPHPLYDLEGTDICLIVKDHKGEGHKEAKARVRAEKTAGVTKVIGVSKLKTKYESHEAKRELCKAYSLFLADSRVLPSLPKLIGKSFFKKKKQPLPVDLRKANWGAQVRAAAAATYMYPASGTCLNIRVARSTMSQQQVLDNCLAALGGAVEQLPHKWKGVRALHLKTADSVALPVYQALPETLPETLAEAEQPGSVSGQEAAPASLPGQAAVQDAPKQLQGKRKPAAAAAVAVAAKPTKAGVKAGKSVGLAARGKVAKKVKA